MMTDALLWHRLQFIFTITYHYLFPQLTMGLALLIVVFKALALRTRDESYNEVARFWGRLFALNFAMAHTGENIILAGQIRRARQLVE